jgi:hypothetical protein
MHALLHHAMSTTTSEATAASAACAQQTSGTTLSIVVSTAACTPSTTCSPACTAPQTCQTGGALGAFCITPAPAVSALGPCTVNPPSCANGGTCQPNSGCVCAAGWTGPTCTLRSTAASPSTNTNLSLIIGLTVGGVLLVAVAAAIVGAVRRYRTVWHVRRVRESSVLRPLASLTTVQDLSKPLLQESLTEGERSERCLR